MKPLTIACFGLFFLGVVLFLGQMWLHIWTPDVFIKLVITDGCVLAIVFVLSFLIKENATSKKIGGDEL